MACYGQMLDRKQAMWTILAALSPLEQVRARAGQAMQARQGCTHACMAPLRRLRWRSAVRYTFSCHAWRGRPGRDPVVSARALQAVVVWRLGPANVFDRAHPSGHYVLDVSNPAHESVAKRLVDIAGNSSDMPNIWNLRMNGCKKSITENK